MNKKQLPLIQIKSIKKVKDALREKATEYGEIKLMREDGSTMEFHDSDISSNFFFEIRGQRISTGKVIYTLDFAPASDLVITSKVIQAGEDSVIIYFNQWIDRIIMYNTTNLTPEDDILISYEEEFYDQFELVEDGTEEQPYTLDVQIKIDSLLEGFETRLIELSNQHDVEDIIDETKSLRSTLTTETKRSTVKKISRILSKIRRMGLDVLIQFYDVGKKEVIKSVLHGTWENLKNIDF